MPNLPERLERCQVFIALLFGLLLSSGCSSFDRAWAKSAHEPVPGNRLLGSWGGSWKSEANGHNGSLRCVITERGDGTYKARFHAIYKKVIGFGYTAKLLATETNGIFQFKGEADLGWWAGGVYQYEGHAGETNFFSTYRCNYDHGTFQMTRPFQPVPGLNH